MEDKKIEILERASAVYMKNGIRSVTMDDLARELGISKKTIYKYFKDKDDLVLSIIELKVEMDKALCINSTQQSENSIDDLINLSKLIIENIGNINPNVFYDMKKYHPEAWGLMSKHKWEFVLSMIRDNINRGIKEGIYRKDLKVEIIARLYVGTTEMIMSGEVFLWPEFKFENVFREMIQFQIKGMANEKGMQYFNKRLSNENK